MTGAELEDADLDDPAKATRPTENRPDLSEEARFARVAEALPIALVMVAGDGRIELVNRQAVAMFGHDRAALVGQPLELLMPERFRGQHVGVRQHFLANMSARIMGEGRELFGLRQDNSEFPLEIGLNPIELDGVTMVLASIIDITARHEIEQQKERQRLELVRSNADLEEFAYVASHDLKAPLRAIAHLAQWIGEDIEATAGPETLENLTLLRARVTRLQLLLDGLLAYSRVGRSHVEVEDVEVAELVADIVAMLAPPPGFTVACEGALPVLRTHRTPLRVVLENLISNALKHHDRGEGRITVAMHLADGVAKFRVSDDGPGIPERFHDRIFVIFQTLASRDDVEASGIGLAIVKKKVQGHGGQIHVESAPPARGASFVFTWCEAGGREAGEREGGGQETA
jgi:PAS domain S-box-containing protein